MLIKNPIYSFCVQRSFIPQAIGFILDLLGIEIC